MTIRPCKHCGRTGTIVNNTKDITVRTGEKCFNCNGRGYTIIPKESTTEKEVKQ